MKLLKKTMLAALMCTCSFSALSAMQTNDPEARKRAGYPIEQNNVEKKPRSDEPLLIDYTQFPCAYFGNNDIKNALIHFISQEKKSIKGAMYEIFSEELVTALIAARTKNNIDIELYVDAKESKNQKMERLLTSMRESKIIIYFANGIKNDGIMHHKFLILGDEIIITGSSNLNDNNKYENICCIKDLTLVQEYTKELERIEKSEQDSFKRFNNKDILLPLVRFNGIKNQLLFPLIQAEQQGISMATMLFALDDVASEIYKKYLVPNFKIRILLDKGYTKKEYDAYDTTSKSIKILQKAKASIKVSQQKNIHHKFFIFHKNINDKPIIMTGSYNLSNTASYNNRENVIVFDDERLVKQYLDEFDRVEKDCKAINQKR